jgi:DNA end-binding protein Ku
MWKGRLVLGKHELPLKMYAAIQDRMVHFRLLHAKDLEPVEQKIVRKTDGEEVPREAQRKAYPVGRETAVILEPDELAAIEPEPTRDIRLDRFVPAAKIDPQWYDRPYYLGPDGDAEEYFALAEAIEGAALAGVARWVMRKKRYIGALTALDGYLTLTTLRRAEQVLGVPDWKAPRSVKPDEKELKLARQIVSAIEGEFDPSLWQDEYHERVCRLIEAKARGRKVKLARAEPRKATGELADALRRSLATVKERKAA